MKSGNWIPVDKRIINLLPRDREYTFIEAYISYRVDIENGEENSINGYSRIWSWSRNKVRHFVEGLSATNGHIVDNKGTGKGQEIRLLFKDLQEVVDNKGTGKGQEEVNKGTTTIIIEKEKEKDSSAKPIFKNNSAQRLSDCFADKIADIKRLFPNVNSELELEKMTAYYSSKTLGTDTWLVVMQWLERAKSSVKQTDNYMTAEKVTSLSDLLMFPVDSRPAVLKQLTSEIQNNIQLEIHRARGVVY